jgi:hypothetical protein
VVVRGLKISMGCVLFALCACGTSGDDSGNDQVSGSGGVSPIIGVSTGGTSAAPGTGGSMAATGGSGGVQPMTGSGGMHAMPGSGGMSAPAGSGGMPAMMSDAGMMPGMSDAGGGGPGSAAQPLPAIDDYTKDGPFKTMVEPNMGPGSNYTIYRPDPLGDNGFLHSPITFGPGISTSCAPGGLLNVYTTLLTHLASHGFVTICVNSIGGGPGDPANVKAMQDGLEWLIAQNTESGSMYEGKLAVDRAIASGYSIGATASTELSNHPAIMTVVSIHGHNTMGDPHGPIWLTTGTDDVIDDNRATLKTLTEAPAIMTALPIGHLDVPTEIGANGRYIAPITAWLRYWVNGDQGAKDFFFGDSCKVCSDPWITPESNDMWKALK